jgi:SAM-dependent methyltransferase
VAAAAFYDAYGEREWTRFEDGTTPSSSLAAHVAELRRFVRPGDRVLDAGCGPGRFTIELARLGARVVAADLSPGQLELHARHTSEVDDAVESRVVADVTALPFGDDEFDATVCFGGALSYVLDEASRAAAELARVTRPGGHVLVSVMSLVGTTLAVPGGVPELVALVGERVVRRVTATGCLGPEQMNGHLAMRMFRARELVALLEPHGRVVARRAAGIFRRGETGCDRALLDELELDLGAEPGAVDAGHHIVAVLEVA